MPEIGQDKLSPKTSTRKYSSQVSLHSDIEDKSLSPEEILKQVVRKASTKKRTLTVAKTPVLTAQEVNQIVVEQAERLLSDALTSMQAEWLEKMEALEKKLSSQVHLHQAMQTDLGLLRLANEEQKQIELAQAERLEQLEKEVLAAQTKIEKLKSRKTPVAEDKPAEVKTVLLPEVAEAATITTTEITESPEVSDVSPVAVQATKMMSALANTFKKAMAKLPRIELSETEEEDVVKPVVSTPASTPEKFGHHFTSSTSLSFVLEAGLEHEKLIDQLPTLLQEQGLLTTCVQVTDKQEQVAVNFGTVVPNLPLLKNNMKKTQRYEMTFEKTEEGSKSVILWMKSTRDSDSHWHAKGELEFGSVPTFSLLFRCVKLVAELGCQSLDIQALHHRGAELLLGGVMYIISDVVAALAKKQGLNVNQAMTENPMLIDYIQQALDSAVLA